METVVAQITNTPWKERRTYVLKAPGHTPDREHVATSENAGQPMRFQFVKDFHISPFIEMGVDFDWRFGAPGKNLCVHMENRRQGEKFFDATLSLRRRPLDAGHLARVLFRYPLMTVQVVAGIYWQALCLWRRKCPVYSHPGEYAWAENKRRKETLS